MSLHLNSFLYFKYIYLLVSHYRNLNLCLWLQNEYKFAQSDPEIKYRSAMLTPRENGSWEGRGLLDLSYLAAGLIFHFLSQAYAYYSACLSCCAEEMLVDFCVIWKGLINCIVASCYCLSLWWCENLVPWVLTLCLYKTFDVPVFESSGCLYWSREAAQLGCWDLELNFCSSGIIKIGAEISAQI